MLTAAHLIVLAKAARPAIAAHVAPPPGYVPVPGSTVGLFHKREGAHFVYWSPHGGYTREPTEPATAVERGRRLAHIYQHHRDAYDIAWHATEPGRPEMGPSRPAVPAGLNGWRPGMPRRYFSARTPQKLLAHLAAGYPGDAKHDAIWAALPPEHRVHAPSDAQEAEARIADLRFATSKDLGAPDLRYAYWDHAAEAVADPNHPDHEEAKTWAAGHWGRLNSADLERLTDLKRSRGKSSSRRDTKADKALDALHEGAKAAGFHRWLANEYPEEHGALLADQKHRREELARFLGDEHSIHIRDDGAAEFDQLTPTVRRILGSHPVVLNHHSSSALRSKVKQEGLHARGQAASPYLNSRAGVYLTTQNAGPAVDGYSRNAVALHGGRPHTFEVRTTIPELEHDPDDQDIPELRGRQFILPEVEPADVLNKATGTESAPPPGYAPIPGSLHGGHEGTGPEGRPAHWYPSEAHARRAETDHALRAHDEEYWATAFRDTREHTAGSPEAIAEVRSHEVEAERQHRLARLAREAIDRQSLAKATTASAPMSSAGRAAGKAAWLVQTLKTLAHGVVAKPPPGFSPIPGSRHQGYHKQVGGRWVHWYPTEIHARHAAVAHTAAQAKAARIMAQHAEAEDVMNAHHEQTGGRVSRYSVARDRFAGRANAAAQQVAHHRDMAAGAREFLDAHKRQQDEPEQAGGPRAVPLTERLHHHMARLLGAVIALRGAKAATKRKGAVADPNKRKRRAPGRAQPRGAAQEDTIAAHARRLRSNPPAAGGEDPGDASDWLRARPDKPPNAEGRLIDRIRAAAERAAAQEDANAAHARRLRDSSQHAPRPSKPPRPPPVKKPTALHRRPALGDDEPTEARAYERPINRRPPKKAKPRA